MEPTVAIVAGLRASAARVEQASPAALVRRMLAEYGRAQLFEWYKASLVGKVVFDVDGKASATTAAALLEAALAALDAFFGVGPDTPRPRILIAASHGDPDAAVNADKLSYRIYVLGFRMRMSDIKRRLLRLRLDDKHGGPFDAAIYSANQKLRMAGSIKTPDDPRNLALVDSTGAPREPTAALLMDTLVQVVDDSWPLIEEPTDAPALALAPAPTGAPQPRPAKRARTQPTVQPEPAAPESHAAAPEDSRYRVPADRDRAFQLLRDNGFLNPEQVGLPRSSSLTFRADNRGAAHPCPCCANDHDHHNWYCCQGADGVLLARSYSDRCRLTPMRPVPQIGADREAAQALIQQRLELVERRQGQTELELQVLRNTVVDFGPHIEATLNQRISPSSIVIRAGGGSFDFSCEADRARYLCEILVTPTCRLSCTSDHSVQPIVAGWVGNETLNNIINSERADTAYVEAFRMHERRQLGVEWRCSGDFFYSSGLTWARVRDEQFLEKRILDLLQPVLATLNHVANSNCLPAEMEAAERKRIRTGLRRAHNHIQHNRATRDILKSARTVFHAPDFADRMDRERHLLGTLDGALDLRTGQLVPREAFPMVSMSVRPKWRGLDLPTPDVDAFFRMVFADDPAMVDYMQALLGAAITGERLEVYACFVGAGANGKGVTVGWLRHVLADYYKEADSYIFFGDKRHGTGPTPALAELDRKRLAVVDESNPADELNLAIVKRVTGTDVISCRQLYKDPVEMPITHTQILLTNNLPKFDVDDQALERRIIVIPFNLKFVKDADYDEAQPAHRRADPTLARFLEGESPSEQLLTWLVRGAMRFYAAGNKLPTKPVVVRDAERGYYENNDILGQLIAEHCELGEGLQAEACTLNSLAREKGVARGIRGAMERRGFPLKKVREGSCTKNIYAGLKLTL